MVGLLATALLLANNLRDIATDTESGKRTLAVRVGRRPAGWCYVACVALPFVGIVVWGLLAVTCTIRHGMARAGCSCRCWPRRWPWRRCGWPSVTPRAGPSYRCWPPRGACSWRSGPLWPSPCG